MFKKLWACARRFFWRPRSASEAILAAYGHLRQINSNHSVRVTFDAEKHGYVHIIDKDFRNNLDGDIIIDQRNFPGMVLSFRLPTRRGTVRNDRAQADRAAASASA